jgi:hypothetical protein
MLAEPATMTLENVAANGRLQGGGVGRRLLKFAKTVGSQGMANSNLYQRDDGKQCRLLCSA